MIRVDTDTGECYTLEEYKCKYHVWIKGGEEMHEEYFFKQWDKLKIVCYEEGTDIDELKRKMLFIYGNPAQSFVDALKKDQLLYNLAMAKLI